MGHEAKIRIDQIQTNNEGAGGWNSLKFWEDQFDKVRAIVDGMRPGEMHTASTAYNELAKRIDASARLIYNQGTKMSESWGGEDAEKAMTQMNKAYRQAQEIHDESDTTSKALKTHGDEQAKWQATYGSNSSTQKWVNGVVDWGQRYMKFNPAAAQLAIGGFIANNFSAGQAMDVINNGTKESNNNFPPGIRQDMPQTNNNLWEKDPPGGGGKPPGSPKMPGGGAPPGGGPGGVPGGPGGAPEMPGGPGGPGDPPGGPGGPGMPPGGPGGPGDPPGGPGGPGIPSGPGGPGTDLATGGGPGLGGGGGGLGAGGVGGGPGGGPSGLGAGGVGAGPGGLGAGPGGAGMVGGPGALGGKNGLGKGGMSGMGMPMGAGGGGRGGEGNEHERSTWLTEDEDVWGGNDDTAPPVIG